MASSKPKAQSQDTFKRGFKSSADKLSVECRLQLNLKDFDPLEAFSLARHLNLEVITPQELPCMNPFLLKSLLEPPGSEHWSAVTLGKDSKPCLIIYNNSHSVARIQSDVMHELAHVLLGHQMEEIDTSFGLPLRKYNQGQENEAEWLGACLQLPKQALIKYFIYQDFSAEQVATTFNASLAMVRFRIGVSGVQILKNRLLQKKLSK